MGHGAAAVEVSLISFGKQTDICPHLAGTLPLTCPSHQKQALQRLCSPLPSPPAGVFASHQHPTQVTLPILSVNYLEGLSVG